ncbi:hypothetical protein RB195_012571 [Necator americanus]|uniref:Uncharacterized protein n=1 Tax=Necator americanus TaxID=51031 RepID=A0ABR1DRJ1_NECAM
MDSVKAGIAEAISILEKLVKLGRVKSLTRTLHALLHTAMKHQNAEEISRVEAVVKTFLPSSLERLKGFIQLELGRKAEFVESLKGNRLDPSHLRFILDLAAKLRTVAVLHSLLDLSILLQLRTQERASVYDELIIIYGKLGDAAQLEKILDLVFSEKEKEHFRATIARLAHFYRCLGLETPTKLLSSL